MAVGEAAPEFSGTSWDGRPVSLSSFRGQPVVLYFYPKASSSGCSIEARGFTEHYAEFQQAGIAVVGVSVDSVEAQRRFHDKCQIPYPLVADDDRSIARSYGVLGIFGVAKRVTFFLDADGRVSEIVEGLIPGPHVRAALARLKAPPTSAAVARPP